MDAEPGDDALVDILALPKPALPRESSRGSRPGYSGVLELTGQRQGHVVAQQRGLRQPRGQLGSPARRHAPDWAVAAVPDTCNFWLYGCRASLPAHAPGLAFLWQETTEPDLLAEWAAANRANDLTERGGHGSRTITPLRTV
jgi:hypothetical protein